MNEDGADAVLIDIRTGIARLTLNRAHCRNALNAAMHAALRTALDRIESDASVGVLILSGAGQGFCAGQDLTERASQLAAGEVDLRASLEENYNPLIRRLAALPFPVIASVNGVAAGAGAALALGCDIVIAARSAFFQFSFAKVGLGPDSGASWLLPRLVGQSRALALALTAEPVGAEAAERIGLIWRAVDDDVLSDEADRLALSFSTGPRAAQASIKAQIRVAAGISFDAALDAERDAQGILGRNPDYREAVMAFAAKRKPAFNR